MVRFLLPLGVAAILSGCAGVDPAGLRAAAALSPLDADPAALSLRVEATPGYGLHPESARLRLAVSAPAGPGVDVVVTLHQRAAGSGGIRLGVAPRDLPRLAAAQARGRALKALHGRAAVGTLSLSAAPCRTAQATGAGFATVWLRTAPDAPGVPLLRDVPIAALAPGGTVAALPACG